MLFAATCCAGWYYCTAQTDKVGTSSHFVISFKTETSSNYRQLLFRTHQLNTSSFLTALRICNFYDWYWLSNTPVNVTNPLLHCTQVRKCRLYIDFHYTVECFKDALQNHRCSLPTGGARCCFAQRLHRRLHSPALWLLMRLLLPSQTLFISIILCSFTY